MATLVQTLEDGKYNFIVDHDDLNRWHERHPAMSHLIEMMVDYVEKRWYPGDALGGMLENDLKKFFSHADYNTLSHAADLFRFVYNVLPEVCWGSPEKVGKFLRREEEF